MSARSSSLRSPIPYSSGRQAARMPVPPSSPKPQRRSYADLPGSRYNSSSTLSAGRKYGIGGTSYGSTAVQRRPLPDGPGPLDRYGNKMDPTTHTSFKPRRTSVASTVRNGPLKADHDFTTSYDSTASTRTSTLPRTQRTSSISDLTSDLDRMNTSGRITPSRFSRHRGNTLQLNDENKARTEKSRDETIDGYSLPSSKYNGYSAKQESKYDSGYNSFSSTKSDNNDAISTSSYRHKERISATFKPDITTTSPVRPVTRYSSEDDSSSPGSRLSHSNAASGRQDSVASIGSNSNSHIGKDNAVISPVAGKEKCGLTGLRNVGNTCFMNSILQCLSNTQLLVEYCLKDNYAKDLNKTTSSMKGQLMNAYASLMKQLWKDYTDCVSPTSFKSQIQRFAPRFMGYNQQDSQEFLRYLLQGLHEDINRVQSKPKPMIISDKDEENLSTSEKATMYWKSYLRIDDSKIVDLFVGQLRSTLTCTACDHSSVTFDPFWDLSVPIPKSSNITIMHCIQEFMREEILDDDERPTCERCKTRRKCTKTFSIQKFPQILVLHLKRFSGERFRSKLATYVDFPMNLDLSEFAGETKGHRPVYNLYGVSNHSGTVFSGHYTAYCKHPYNKDWYHYNDSRVSPISSNRVTSSEAYVLFYELAHHNAKL
ncbi:ubiquitin carboxyl-terminal hydrolase 2 [Lingula anatina]|uniref:Ubiquitin carboxyl-terminal hydrolase n=1 Tax=Lingula anatina TaxID=7574 RepID=A0A1S3KEP6_LINAN|nr:ubiquitin carboxyl-terminal hydrolase 2 [Lingula anatina]XP_013420930.1 ubiquitin carboxyl-terminal hydrolase 2 [Lingula anatina]XP_013420931.1 ubiquitin carboxyl-terminal hydrolase 2 [Lingula anatina]|eukprot:XP_013420929.1 ubiquitin carboxyl-terminal hydrolase 2 [Lingula anatina]